VSCSELQLTNTLLIDWGYRLLVGDPWGGRHWVDRDDVYDHTISSLEQPMRLEVWKGRRSSTPRHVLVARMADLVAATRPLDEPVTVEDTIERVVVPWVTVAAGLWLECVCDRRTGRWVVGDAHEGYEPYPGAAWERFGPVDEPSPTATTDT
jgi:hypothetical protein